MIALQGTGVSAGIATGPIHFLHRAQPVPVRHTVADPEQELARWQSATKRAAAQLEKLAARARAEVGADAATLFETHQLMLEDLDYTERIATLITSQKLNAEAAVSEAGKQFAAMFEAMDDVYMQARSTDVTDISARVIRILCQAEEETFTMDAPIVLAADDLTPSETMQLDKSRLLGVLLRNGSSTSHTAILARSLGIPAIIRIGDALAPELDGRTVMLDGSVGYAVVDPDETTKLYLVKKQQSEAAVRAMLAQLKGQPDITSDGRHIRLYANITSPADVDAVLANDARGIGLFRSEFLYLQSNAQPSEEVQFEAYKSVLQRMNGNPVIIRTLDIGADKKVSYLALPEEENPALGMRALRLCLTRPALFKTQLRALYRASAYGKLSIMFPMVASLWEVQEAKRLCSAVRKELQRARIPFDERLPLGVMIETPAAVMIAPALAKEVSFFSIGTNDLTQYTLAVDRQSTAGMERFYDLHHPAVMEMIRLTIDAAHAAGIWVGICGEIAAELSLTERFLAMGVDELSVSPRCVLPLRNAIRNAAPPEKA